MKRRKIFGFAVVLLLAGFVSSCSTGVAPESAPPMMPVSTVGGGSSMIFNKPQQLRSGIATGWGREKKSELTYRAFVRSSQKPKGVALIRYNDLEGAKAMGVNRKAQQPGMMNAANGLVQWGMTGGIGVVENCWWRDDRFVIGKKGREYQIQVRNMTDARLEVVLSVDGLDVMDGKPASVKKRGYLVAPGKKLVVRGFRTSEEKVAAFKFSSVDQSYANLRHGNTRNVGVVGLAVYTEKDREPGAEGRARGNANPFAEAPPVQGR